MGLREQLGLPPKTAVFLMAPSGASANFSRSGSTRVTGSGRIWYLVDEERRRVIVMHAGTGPRRLPCSERRRRRDSNS